jgi:hypothetical protein
MKIFHCGRCDQIVFFENTVCVNCGRTLAYLPDREDMGTLEPAGHGLWRTVERGGGGGRQYRLCVNYSNENVCNWAVPADDPNGYCRSCRLTRVIPDLWRPGLREAWARLEAAKRRMLAGVLTQGLPLVSKYDDPGRGLAFEFLADVGPPGTPPVLTGHADGLITVNVAEADDAERERRKKEMREPYRTLLGHFRHEIGHHYWDLLVRDTDRLPGFRRLFGDEREDYGEALRRHHESGAPGGWENTFVSAYASAHPWEDWAETWAHHLHITDTLETALSCGLSLRPHHPGEPSFAPDVAAVGPRAPGFGVLIERWLALAYVLNNLNRGMGLPDAYPFVLPPPAIEKLRFVHDVIADAVASLRGD